MDHTTRISDLTVAEFQALLAGTQSKEEAREPQKRYVYGIRGIRDLLGVSHKTACTYKSSWLAPAVKQNGRKIITDADLALQLFSQR